MSHFLKLPGLPPDAVPLLERLLQEDFLPIEALANIVESYREVINEAHARHGIANAEIGGAIADASLDLLDVMDDRASHDTRRVLQAGIRYFVIENDGQGSDLATVEGLDDDARVMNAVLRYFGRDELFIDVPDRPPARRTREAQARPRGLMSRLRRSR